MRKWRKVVSPRKELTEAVGPIEKVGWCSYSKMPIKGNQNIRVRGTNFQILKTNARAFQHFSYSSTISVAFLFRFLF